YYPHPPTPPLYILSLHDALPISRFLGVLDDVVVDALDERVLEALGHREPAPPEVLLAPRAALALIARRELEQPLGGIRAAVQDRSEEHTSELQSPDQLVCRLLLE